MSEYVTISKQLGWDHMPIDYYPSIDAVEAASNYLIFKWHRFLRPPQTDEELQIINRIFERFGQIPH